MSELACIIDWWPARLSFECTMTLARRVWNIRPTTLPNVCRYLRIPLKHHDAASDAEACARIMIAANKGEPCSLARSSRHAP